MRFPVEILFVVRIFLEVVRVVLVWGCLLVVVWVYVCKVMVMGWDMWVLSFTLVLMRIFPMGWYL